MKTLVIALIIVSCIQGVILDKATQKMVVFYAVYMETIPLPKLGQWILALTRCGGEAFYLKLQILPWLGWFLVVAIRGQKDFTLPRMLLVATINFAAFLSILFGVLVGLVALMQAMPMNNDDGGTLPMLTNGVIAGLLLLIGLVTVLKARSKSKKSI